MYSKCKIVGEQLGDEHGKAVAGVVSAVRGVFVDCMERRVGDEVNAPRYRIDVRA